MARHELYELLVIISKLFDVFVFHLLKLVKISADEGKAMMEYETEHT